MDMAGSRSRQLSADVGLRRATNQCLEYAGAEFEQIRISRVERKSRMGVKKSFIVAHA